MRLRVVIVENRELVAARLKAKLEILDHDVVALAKDGWQALTSIDKLAPDLILMDFRLPGMDGIQAARTILTQRAVPIILLTAYSGADLARRAREAGIMAFLKEPVDAGQLRATIEAAMARFAELEAVHQEVTNLKEAWETRKSVEQAKTALVRWLRLSEGEAFRDLQKRSRNTNGNLEEIASTISTVDKFLLRKLGGVLSLEIIVSAIRRGLESRAARSPAAISVEGASRVTPGEGALPVLREPR
ncbi:MAG: response regulator [Candidatus Rokuibacteriota bacterium]|nr:MAG: response regulator [Candidatus Rokubacteria bacterium]